MPAFGALGESCVIGVASAVRQREGAITNVRDLKPALRQGSPQAGGTSPLPLGRESALHNMAANMTTTLVVRRRRSA